MIVGLAVSPSIWLPLDLPSGLVTYGAYPWFEGELDSYIAPLLTLVSCRRFPALAKDYGGGAFFVSHSLVLLVGLFAMQERNAHTRYYVFPQIPYLMAFVLIGLPVLILEISLGQTQQTGNVGVFGYFHKRFRGVGMASVACAFMLVVYYSILLAWVTRGKLTCTLLKALTHSY